MATGGNPDEIFEVVQSSPEQQKEYTNLDFRKDDGVVFYVGYTAYNLLPNPYARDEAARGRLA